VTRAAGEVRLAGRAAPWAAGRPRAEK